MPDLVTLHSTWNEPDAVAEGSISLANDKYLAKKLSPKEAPSKASPSINGQGISSYETIKLT